MHGFKKHIFLILFYNIKITNGTWVLTNINTIWVHNETYQYTYTYCYHTKLSTCLTLNLSGPYEIIQACLTLEKHVNYGSYNLWGYGMFLKLFFGGCGRCFWNFSVAAVVRNVCIMMKIYSIVKSSIELGRRVTSWKVNQICKLMFNMLVNGISCLCRLVQLEKTNKNCVLIFTVHLVLMYDSSSKRSYVDDVGT